MNQTTTLFANMPQNESHMPPWPQRLLAGVVIGLLVGLTCRFLIQPAVTLAYALVTSVGLGLLFALWFAPHLHTTGARLMGGQALGVLWWLCGTLTLLPLLRGEAMLWSVNDVETLFAQLLMGWVGQGTLIGLLYDGVSRWWRWRNPPPPTPIHTTKRRPQSQAVVPPVVQASIIGAFAGLLGSWVFAWGIDRNAFYPIVAQIVGAESRVIGQLLHYVIGTIIGVSFGLLYVREAQSPGKGLLWGINYGLLWWVIGPITIMPWLLGSRQPADWSLHTAQQFVPSLIAHLLYGALVGYLLGIANKLWEVLFVASDPLNRTRAGVQSVQGILWGTAGGVVGGLLFTVIMAGVGALPAVAQLIGAQAAWIGFLVHLVISVVIGIGYGLLLQRQVDGYGIGLAWGMLYGVFWWVLGALTLFPLLLRQPVAWSPAIIAGAYPSLIGHLLYGAGLGLFFHYLAQREGLVPADGSPTAQAANRAAIALTGTSTAALWIVTLLIVVLLPLLLSANQPGSSLYR